MTSPQVVTALEKTASQHHSNWNEKNPKQHHVVGHVEQSTMVASMQIWPETSERTKNERTSKQTNKRTNE